MRFRAYLRTFDGQVSEKTVTTDPNTALAAFATLVERADLDGQKFAVALTGDNRQIAFHRFDRSVGEPDYWRGRIDEIEIPGLGRGRPAEMTDGRRIQVYLDAASLKIAERLGGGNVSAGIRAALAAANANEN